MNYLIFSLVFTYITNWVRIKYLFSKLIKTNNHKPLVDLQDQMLIAKYQHKLGLNLQIKIFQSTSISGAMPGVPWKPILLLSTAATEKLAPAELDWIICHEAGHCKQWHVVKVMLVWIYLLISGIVVLNQYNFFSSFILGFCLAILFNISERYISEYPADVFALNHVDSLKGMISANRKLQAQSTSIFYKHPLLTFIFTPHLTYTQRITMAQHRISTTKHMAV